MTDNSQHVLLTAIEWHEHASELINSFIRCSENEKFIGIKK